MHQSLNTMGILRVHVKCEIQIGTLNLNKWRAMEPRGISSEWNGIKWWWWRWRGRKKKWKREINPRIIINNGCWRQQPQENALSIFLQLSINFNFKNDFRAPFRDFWFLYWGRFVLFIDFLSELTTIVRFGYKGTEVAENLPLFGYHEHAYAKRNWSLSSLGD